MASSTARPVRARLQTGAIRSTTAERLASRLWIPSPVLIRTAARPSGPSLNRCATVD